MNASLAVATVHQLLGADFNSTEVGQALQTFQGLPGRQEQIGIVNGVTYINDATSTMPDAVITALKAFQDKSIILITGGNDKQLDYTNIKKVAANSNLKKVLLVPGTALAKLQEEFSPDIIQNMSSTSEAFKVATELAEAGDYVLYSPAATSFGEFRHEFDRSDSFKEYVTNLT